MFVSQVSVKIDKSKFIVFYKKIMIVLEENSLSVEKSKS